MPGYCRAPSLSPCALAAALAAAERPLHSSCSQLTAPPCCCGKELTSPVRRRYRRVRSPQPWPLLRTAAALLVQLADSAAVLLRQGAHEPQVEARQRRRPGIFGHRRVMRWSRAPTAIPRAAAPTATAPNGHRSRRPLLLTVLAPSDRCS